MIDERKVLTISPALLRARLSTYLISCYKNILAQRYNIRYKYIYVNIGRSK